MATLAVSEQKVELVTFTLGEEEYAADILKVLEINRMREITKIPDGPPYMEGVINLRGKVVPVISLRKRFGLEVIEHDEQARIMIMDIQGSTMGLIVDSVSEVLRVPANIIEPPPPVVSGKEGESIRGIAKLEDRLIIFLDMDNAVGKSDDTPMIEHALRTSDQLN